MATVGTMNASEPSAVKSDIFLPAALADVAIAIKGLDQRGIPTERENL